MEKICFIGLGNMGRPMAMNLMNAGYQVSGFDVVAAACEMFVQDGGHVCEDLNNDLSVADIVITMLPAGPQVRRVYEDTILPNVNSSAILIDCSTIDVATARSVAAEALARGIVMIDAPVSGGTVGAKAGTLTFMVGGPDEVVEKTRPILDIMGQKIVHAGASGNGQAAKICNNMMLGIQMLSVAEAFNLAESLGLEAQKLFDISSTSSGQCWSLTTYCPVPGPVPTSPANNDYKPGFSVAMMHKDLSLAEMTAMDGKVATPLGNHAASLYRMFCAAGGEDMDFSSIINFLKNGQSKP